MVEEGEEILIGGAICCGLRGHKVMGGMGSFKQRQTQMMKSQAA